MDLLDSNTLVGGFCCYYQSPGIKSYQAPWISDFSQLIEFAMEFPMKNSDAIKS
jgi:hypothetical protein